MTILISLAVLLSIYLLTGFIMAIRIVKSVTDEEIEEGLYEELRGNPFKEEFLYYAKKRWLLLIAFTIIGPADVINEFINGEEDRDE
ncbi:hypothetical protein [Brevibacillus borstelensis]|uniref:hypothetical protein n=1 Tax=Brevibacillus borstelensis TaxID=45462 RepID=UPI0030BC7DCD